MGYYFRTLKINVMPAKTAVDREGNTNPTRNFPMEFTVDESALRQNRLTLIFNLRFDKDVVQGYVPVKKLTDSIDTGKLQSFTCQMIKLSGEPMGELSFSCKWGEKFARSAAASAKYDAPSTAYPGTAMGDSSVAAKARSSYGYPPPPPPRYNTGAYQPTPPPPPYNTEAYPPPSLGNVYPPPPYNTEAYPPPSPDYVYPPPHPSYVYPPPPPVYVHPPPPPYGAYPRPGYAYAPQPGYGYPQPAQQPAANNRFEIGLLGGLVGEVLGGLIVDSINNIIG